jgi:hypothetical protein
VASQPVVGATPVEATKVENLGAAMTVGAQHGFSRCQFVRMARNSRRRIGMISVKPGS